MQACEFDVDDLAPVELMEHQKDVLPFISNGKILYGGVGAGKSLTAVAYYAQSEAPRDLFVITTAKKRDSLEWVGESAKFGIGCDYDSTLGGVLTVDSWNNIRKYVDVKDAFFIFDEQRVVGHGTWVKSFLKIAKQNRWILLSATPGDTWLDYAPVFIANGWFKNITEFKRKHVLYAPYTKYPQVIGYLGEERLEKLRNEVLVEMPYVKHTERIMNYMDVSYDRELVRAVVRNRWHVYEDRPLKDAADMWRLVRRIVNSDPSRFEMIKFLLKFHPRLIVFYNFDYELDILRWLGDSVTTAEWNGHRKDPIPSCDSWVYLVQYTAGGEGWNCTATNSMVLYSLTYSYKNFVQSQGRIDRLNTEFVELYYYILTSNSVVDLAVKKALAGKHSFNEREELRKGGIFRQNFANAE
jgi:hypothetical protein